MCDCDLHDANKSVHHNDKDKKRKEQHWQASECNRDRCFCSNDPEERAVAGQSLESWCGKKILVWQ